MILLESRKVRVQRKQFSFRRSASYENLGAWLDNRTLPAGRIARLSSRVSDSVGTLLIQSSQTVAGYLISGDKVCLGWYNTAGGGEDTDGPFQVRTNVNVVVSGFNATLTLSLGGGAVLPVVNTYISVGFQYTEVISSNRNPILVSCNTENSQVAHMIGLAADIATPTYANALIGGIDRAQEQNDTIYINDADFNNANYVTGDRAYVANVSGIKKWIAASVGSNAVTAPSSITILPLTG